MSQGQRSLERWRGSQKRKHAQKLGVSAQTSLSACTPRWPHCQSLAETMEHAYWKRVGAGSIDGLGMFSGMRPISMTLLKNTVSTAREPITGSGAEPPAGSRVNQGVREVRLIKLNAILHHHNLNSRPNLFFQNKKNHRRFGWGTAP